MKPGDRVVVNSMEFTIRADTSFLQDALDKAAKQIAADIDAAIMRSFTADYGQATFLPKSVPVDVTPERSALDDRVAVSLRAVRQQAVTHLRPKRLITLDD